MRQKKVLSFINRVLSNVLMTRIPVFSLPKKMGEVVGYVLGMIADIMAEVFQPIRSGFLADIYVQEDYRRHGIGKELVERLILWFQSKDITYYEWHVAQKTKMLWNFWRNDGW